MATKSSSAASMNNNAASHRRGSGGDGHHKKKRPSTSTTTGDKNQFSNKKAKGSKIHSSSSGTNKTKASHSKQPVATLHPRKNADIVERGKRLWNSLRCKTNTTAQIREYMDELFPLIQNKAMELTMQHDASRIVQAAIQFGNVTERQQIAQELCRDHHNSTTATATTTTTASSSKHTFLDVCQSQYAHFVILKLLKYCYKDPICLQLLISAFKGHMMKLITHSNGSRIIEVLWQSAYNNNNNSHSSSTSVVIPKDKMAQLKQEMYGPHYALFAQDTLRQLVTLVQNEQSAKTSPNAKEPSFVTPTLRLNIMLLPDKKDITMEHIRNNIIAKGMDKQLYGYDYFQEMLYEYIDVLRMEEQFAAIRDLTTTTNLTDQTIHLLSSKYGCQVVHQCMAYSTPKERKRIVKSCKGYTKSALFHTHAYLVIIRFIQCMDDTVVLYKNILQELLTPSNTSSASNTNAATKSNNTNTHLSISKSKEIVHSTSTTTEEEAPNTLMEIALSDTASKLLLTMLIPTAATSTTEENKASLSSFKMFNPQEQETLSPWNPFILEKVSTNESNSTDHDIASTTTTKNGVSVHKVYTSKKDPELRRFEILQYFHVPLLQLCTNTKNVEALLRSIPGSNILYHVYVATVQALVQKKGDKSSVPTKPINPNMNDQLLQLLNDMIRAICVVCRGNLTVTDEDKADKENIFEHVVGHRIIKNLILYDASLTDDQKMSTNVPSFTESFVPEFASDFMSMIEYNRGAFILVALLQVSSIRTRVLEHLNVARILPSSADHQKEKNPPTPTAGYKALRLELAKLI